MSAWTALLAKSSITADGINTTWQHLLSTLSLGGALTAIGEATGGIVDEVLSASVSEVLSGGITEELLSATVVEETLAGTVDGGMSGSITEEVLTGSLSCS